MCDGCCDGRQDGADDVEYICPLVFSSGGCHMFIQLIVPPSYTNSAEYTTPEIVTSTRMIAPL